MGINLHELANMPGAGNATKELQKAGHWDEDAGKESKKYIVKLSATVSYDETYIVDARSVVEAEEKAIDILTEEHDVDEFDIDDIEVEEME